MLKKLLALLLAISTPVASVACVGGLPAIAAASAVVSEVLAVLSGVNMVVNEFFGRHPDVPASTRDQYVTAYDAVITALTEYQRVAEATNDLNNGDTLAAFAKFQQAYENLLNWLAANNLRNADGALMLEGRVVSSLPPASAFKR